MSSSRHHARPTLCRASWLSASVLLGLATAATGQTARQLEPAPVPPKAEPETPAAPVPAAHELTRQDLETWLDGFVPFALESGDLAGMVIVVVKDGQVLLKRGYGYADVATRRPMDPDRTLVRPGSTTKLFTWTAVMQQVEQGRIDLHRDVNDYLDFKIRSPFKRPITMIDLMTHRPGFEEGLKSILMNDPKLLISTEEYLKTHQRPVVYPPGEVPAYSNYGTALAGYIVQRVSGESYESYVERHIFAPLKMTRSTFQQPLPESLRADMSEGYMAASGPPRPFELLITVPAGALSTTAADMANFMIAHLQRGRFGDTQILKPETAQLMYQPEQGRIDDFNTMAHGFFEENRNGHRIIGHGGDTILFHSDCHLLLDDGVGIFFSFNSRGARDSNYETREALFHGFLDRYFPAPKTEEPSNPAPGISAEHAKLIAGRYQNSRRVETGFVGVFYALEQTVISINHDGSINVPTFPSNEPKPYREIAPLIWREVGGEHEVALVLKEGTKTVYTSEDPTSVLQPTPARKSAALNLAVLGGTVTILLLTAVLWPSAAIARRVRGGTFTLDGRALGAHRILRIGALFDLGYLIAWFFILEPILSNHLEGYNATLDPSIRAMQVAGLGAIAFAVAGPWAAWQIRARVRSFGPTLWNSLIALALLGVVWTGFVCKLIGFNLNY